MVSGLVIHRSAEAGTLDIFKAFYWVLPVGVLQKLKPYEISGLVFSFIAVVNSEGWASNVGYPFLLVFFM